MDEPTTKEEYEARTMANTEVTGFGGQTATVFPCPFCGAKGWRTVAILDMHKSWDEATTCKDCGRGAHVIVEQTAFSTSMRFVQTEGSDAPPWVPIPRETDEEKAKRLGKSPA